MKTSRIYTWRMITVVALALVGSAWAQGPHIVPDVIHYQGKLMDGTNLFSGVVPMAFRLYNEPAGSQGPLCESTNSVAVVDGLYSAVIGDNITWGSLDNALFHHNGEVWLEVEIDGQVIEPREPLAAVPYARVAAAMPANSVDMSMIRDNNIQWWHIAANAVRANHIQNEAVTSGKIQPGAVLLSHIAQGGAVEGQVITWSPAGWVPAGASGGGSGSGVTGLVSYAEHGSFVANPVASGTDSIAQGSAARAIGNYSVVAGGQRNRAEGVISFVGGGGDNTAGGLGAVVGGGASNTAGADGGTIGGGSNNQIIPGGLVAAIVGGGMNEIASEAGFIGGGLYNKMSAPAQHAVIAGGKSNEVHAARSTIGGGDANRIGTTSLNSTIAGGGVNRIENDVYWGTVSGGSGNTLAANAWGATISGGRLHMVNSGAQYATIGGGYDNATGANANYAAVGGGRFNRADQDDATVAGGRGNTAGGEYATVAGGYGNQATGANATVPGGWFNTASGAHGFAAGHRAKAVHQGAFVWADSQGSDFSSSVANQFAVRAAGGVYMNTPTVEATGGVAAREFHAKNHDGSVTGLSIDGQTGNLTTRGTIHAGTAGTGSITCGTVLGTVGVGDIAAGNNLRAEGSIFTGSSKGAGSVVVMNAAGTTTASIGGADGLVYCRTLFNGGSGHDGQINVRDASDAVTAQMRGSDGRVICRELQITGGADLAEKFVVTGDAVEPGMVVSIDPATPGALRVSTGAYDRTVAGIVSGANGIRPGLTLQQEGGIASGDVPVALTGRVYCRVDASYGVIEPGDALTTSGTPGHAMRVNDFARAQGAMIGKAMTGLAEGRGYVLVLVNMN